jgi:excisionase family DNA binding protein
VGALNPIDRFDLSSRGFSGRSTGDQDPFPVTAVEDAKHWSRRCPNLDGELVRAQRSGFRLVQAVRIASRLGYFYNIWCRCSSIDAMRRSAADELDVAAAAAVAGRSAETVRRWVWSGRLRAHRRGNKLLIARTDLDRLLGSSGIAGAISLAEWVAAVESSGLKKGPRGATAADLVLEERRHRSLGRGADARS